MKKWVLSAGVALLGAVAISSSFTGCGSSNTSSNANGVFAGGCIGSGCTSVNGFYGGDTETINFTNMNAVSQYAQMQITNASNAVVSINLTPYGSQPIVYLGQMIIQYNDQNGNVHQGTFVNGTSTAGWNTIGNTVSTKQSNGDYRIMFEDSLGVVVLEVSSGTGTDTVLPASGTVWFSNFNTDAVNPLYAGAYDSDNHYYPPGYVFCWMITVGPYNCRNFNAPPSSPYKDSKSGKTIPPFSLLGNVPTILKSAAGLK